MSTLMNLTTTQLSSVGKLLLIQDVEKNVLNQPAKCTEHRLRQNLQNLSPVSFHLIRTTDNRNFTIQNGGMSLSIPWAEVCFTAMRTQSHEYQTSQVLLGITRSILFNLWGCCAICSFSVQMPFCEHYDPREAAAQRWIFIYNSGTLGSAKVSSCPNSFQLLLGRRVQMNF